jgi:dCMP deaminase
MPKRPDLDDYYLGVAIAVAARAECTGQHVGAVIVGGRNRILSTGYNGTPDGFLNCTEGGCPRCVDSAPYGGSGNGYDKCVCVHAEMNAIASAARHGVSLDRATAYVTHQPCITCGKELAQVGIVRVRYAIELAPPVAKGMRQTAEVQALHSRLLVAIRAKRMPGGAACTALGAAIHTFRKEASRVTSAAAQPDASVTPLRGTKDRGANSAA